MSENDDLKNKLIEEMVKLKAERETLRIAEVDLKNRTRAMQDMIGEKNVRLERKIAEIELRENLLKAGEKDLAEKTAKYVEKVTKLKSLLEIEL